MSRQQQLERGEANGRRWQAIPELRELAAAWRGSYADVLGRYRPEGFARKQRRGDEYAVGAVELPDAARPIFLKALRTGSWRSAWRQGRRGSALSKEWQKAQRAYAAGLPCSRPLALIEVRSWRGLREAFLLFDWVEKTTSLDAWFRGALDRDDVSAIDTMCDAFGEFTGETHRQGFFPSDLKPANVLLTDPDPSPAGLLWVDLKRLLFSQDGEEAARLRARHLARLYWNASLLYREGALTEERTLRFLRGYLRGYPEAGPEASLRKAVADMLPEMRNVARKRQRLEGVPD